MFAVGIVQVIYIAFMLIAIVLAVWIAVLLIKFLQLKITETKLRIASPDQELPE